MHLRIRPFLKRPVTWLLCVAVFAAAVCIPVLLCGSRSMSAAEASRWIAAYPPVRVDRDAFLRLELTDSLSAKLDTTASYDKVFSFSPVLKGQIRLSSDRRYLDFIPSESMRQGREYSCKVDMKRLSGVDSLADFTFDFFVEQREMRFDDVKVTVDPDNIAMMSVTGRLVYSSPVGDNVTATPDVLTCDTPDAIITMADAPVNGGRNFKVSGIKRQEHSRRLTLSVNPRGGFSRAEYEVNIPSVTDFHLLSAERVEGASPYLNLEFSNPLSSQQDLDGLITLEGISDVRIERSGTNVKVYYAPNARPELLLHISDLVKNNEGRSLDEEIEQRFEQPVIAPAVVIPIRGSILPDNRNLRLPFRAVNLAAVDVEVVKINTSNVPAFIQENDLSRSNRLRRFGRLIYHLTVRLDADKSLDLHRWQDFSIDLANLFAQERGAIYNIRLAFRKDYSLYGRSEPVDFEEIDGLTEADRRKWEQASPYVYRDSENDDWVAWDWREVNDPEKISYYMNYNMPEVNIVASDLGVIAKRADDSAVKVAVTNLVTAAPVKDSRVTVYDYQLQPIASGVTDAGGFADIRTSRRPYLLSATAGGSTTYMKVADGRELPTDKFDVNGEVLTDGIKTFIYGERGVWRPGDELHLTLIVEDKKHNLPANHPVTVELYTPADQLYSRQTMTSGVDGFYAFSITTDGEAPTGRWRARFTVGNQSFDHPVRIETIKPNRLKINIKSPELLRANRSDSLGIDARWLTGPVAKGLNASLEMTLYPEPKPFDKFPSYVFRNPIATYTSSEKQLLSGKLNAFGTLTRACLIGTDRDAPGMLRANLTAKVSEAGGDMSIATKSVLFAPFDVFVGIDMGRKEFTTDQDITFPTVVVNQSGQLIKERTLSFKIYRLGYDWWWEGNAMALSRFVKSSTADVVASGNVTAVNGRADIHFRPESSDWGEYLVIVRDVRGGHATGGVISVDLPDWQGRSGSRGIDGSTELDFKLDRRSYKPGETATVYLPQCKGGRVLLSVETGSKVLRRTWVALSGESDTRYSLPVDGSMAPNFYVTATMLRPHKDTDIDTPVRLFGVQCAAVVDPSTILHPVIDMPDELHPGEAFTVKVTEKDRRPMTYTLAIVDEGLLDISNFKTPRPWAAMNRKEALGVRTWDMYDDVIGAFGANFRSIHSVGGDEALRKAAGKEKRFNPVVKFLGPFTTSGAPKTHRIILPNYVGSVRVMVVAAHAGSYGNTDKTAKVTAPLMLLPTLPRVLATTDSVSVPVNVFAMRDDIRRVELSINATGPVRVAGASTIPLTFAGTGEQLATFGLVCDASAEGQARVIVRATAPGYSASDTTFIDVVNPMPYVVTTEDKTLAAHGTAEFTWVPSTHGTASLQVATMPTMNFAGVAGFFDNYPHLCSEQLSSKALFMLYGRQYLGDDARKQCEKSLPSVIKNLLTRQQANGGFVYWPGRQTVDEWVTSMAGIVLAEAAHQGFRVAPECMDKWKKYEEKAARDYRYSLSTDTEQAFRLLALTIAGQTPTAAMNRLRESKQLSQTAAYTLAAAYAETGRKDVAISLIERAERSVAAPSSDMFESPVRNKAIEVYAYAACDMLPKAMAAARSVAADCTGSTYVTQDVAFAAMAFNHLSRLAGDSSGNVRIAASGEAPLVLKNLSGIKDLGLNQSAGKVSVENLGDNVLQLSLMTAGQPSATESITPVSQGLKMAVSYVDMQARPLNIADIKQNTEFRVRITVTSTGDEKDNLALTYTIPAGWEIWNERLIGPLHGTGVYRDIRDSRVNFYFDLRKGISTTFEVRLRAAYPGTYLLPPVVCEDMYNPACRALLPNRRVTVSI